MELHASAKQVQRSKGRSSVAAAAYRAGIKLVDDRTGITHDYTKKYGVEHSRIYAPDNAPEWVHDRSLLWNTVEQRERHVKACTAHELEIGFPAEFNAMQRREAGDNICRELLRRYDCAVDISYHKPSRTGDQRNFHAHILFTSRGFDENTKDGWSKNKFRDLAKDTKDAQKKPYLDAEGKKTTRGTIEVLALRKFAADELNRIAKRDRLDVHTHHESFDKRGIDREPTQHRGNTATEMERKGKTSRIENINRARQKRNAERATLHAKAAQESAKQVIIMSKNGDGKSSSGVTTMEEWDKSINDRLSDLRPNDSEYAALMEEKKWLESGAENRGGSSQANDFNRVTTDERNTPFTADDAAKRRLINKHEQQRMDLAEQQKNDPSRKTIEAEIDATQSRLKATGLKKVVRDVFKVTANDQQRLKDMKLSLRGISASHVVSRDALLDDQKKEMARFGIANDGDPIKEQKPTRGAQTNAGRGDSDSRSTRRETDKPFPEPPPPREAIKVAQEWGENSGQNAEQVNQSVQDRKIDTSKMAMPRDEKSKDFERRSGEEYDNKSFVREDKKPSLADAVKGQEAAKTDKEKVVAPAHQSGNDHKKKSLSEAIEAHEAKRGKPEPTLTPTRSRGRGLDI